MTEQQILKALEVVMDPDLNRNIVELGFVQNLNIAEDGSVSMELVLTTPACPIRDRFKEQCERIILALGASSVEVTLSAKAGRVSSEPENKESFLKGVSHIVAVASGKGGVGKSTVTANLAVALSLSGARVGILDADIYGPSMGVMFGIDQAPFVHEDKTISPVLARGGISIVSMSMFADSDRATIWRGPMASQMIKNFLHRVRWGALDYLLVDFPPGTGDIQLTLTQECPLSGAVVVTTPQEVALADCRKGLSMFDSVGVPVLGVVENMSYFICDECQKEHFIFPQGGGEKISKTFGVPLLGKIPLEAALATCGDQGIPGVLYNPNSVSAEVFTQVASDAVRKISIFAAMASETLSSFNYTFEELPEESL